MHVVQELKTECFNVVMQSSLHRLKLILRVCHPLYNLLQILDLYPQAVNLCKKNVRFFICKIFIIINKSHGVNIFTRDIEGGRWALRG